MNSVMIRPQPPRLRMKRRKTVSVTPGHGGEHRGGGDFQRSDRKAAWGSDAWNLVTGLLNFNYWGPETEPVPKTSFLCKDMTE